MARKSDSLVHTKSMRSATRNTAVLFASIAAVQLGRSARAMGDTYYIDTPGASAWLSGGDWEDSSTSTTGTVPGANDVAEFDADPTGGNASKGFGINFNNATNNGTANQIVGAISVTSTRTNALYLGATANNKNGVLTLNGATINGVANTVLSNFDSGTGSAGTVNIISDVGSNTTSTMTLALANTTNVVQLGAGNATTLGDTFTVLDSITELNSGSSVTVLGGGNSTVNGGTLELAGNNTFTGGITVGNSDGSQAAVLQIDNTGAAPLPTRGTITINANSEFYSSATGNVTTTFGSAGQSLVLNGSGTASNSGAVRILDGTGTFAGTWAGTTTLEGNTLFTLSNSNSFTLNGTVTDNGYQLQKADPGNLILAGNNTGTMTGSTEIENGTITVTAGSSIGTGSLTMASGGGASSPDTTELVLNNAAQTVSNLSSSFSATSGNATQTILLNGTILTINQTATTSYGYESATQQGLASIITGTGGITLGAGSTGKLELSSVNTYSGNTTINGGTLQTLAGGAIAGAGDIFVNGGLLQVNANSSLSGGGAVTVSNNAILGGGGSIAGAITMQGTSSMFEGGSVSAIGTLHAGSNVTFNPDTTLEIKVQAPTGVDGAAQEGIDADVVALTGNSSVFTTGGATLDLIQDSAGGSLNDLSSNVTYVIVDATGGSGNSIDYSTPFAGIAENQIYTSPSGFEYSVNYTSNAIDLTVYAVPEPTSLAFIGFGGVALLRRGRKAKRA